MTVKTKNRQMANILTTIAQDKMRRVQAEINTFGAQIDLSGVTHTPVPMAQALLDSPTGIIAEFKRRSPSRGEIHPMADPAVIVPGYQQAGAAACSVLTDTRFFGGADTDLMVARQNATLPLLRKDFVVHPRQIYRARAIGADAVLLIAALLDADSVAQYTGIAHSLGLQVLLEVHNMAELDRFCPGVDMVGVNNRDLTTFEVDPMLAQKAADRLPGGVVRVAESGLTGFDQVLALRREGYRGFLIGETFMRNADPAQALARFLHNA